MTPDDELMDKPVGRPDADHTNVVIDEFESAAVTVTGTTAVPAVDDCGPGEVTVIVLPVTLQAKDAEPVAPVPSPAVTVAEKVPTTLGVPLMTPVEELIERPAGRPDEDHVNVVVVPFESDAATVIGVIATPPGEVWAPGEVTVTVFTGPFEMTGCESKHDCESFE